MASRFGAFFAWSALRGSARAAVRVIPLAGAAASTAGIASMARFQEGQVFSPGQAIGEALRSEVWKARHENVVILEVQDEGGEPARRLLTLLRNKDTHAIKFRDSARRLLRLIVGTAMSTLDYEEEEVETPDGYRYEGLTMEVSQKLCGIALTDVAGLRRDLEDCLENAPVVDATVVDSAGRVRVSLPSPPADLSERTVFVLDATLSKPEAALAAVEELKKRGVVVENVVLVTIVATRPCVEELSRKAPGLRIVCAAMDPGADAQGRVVPGMGDFASRFNEGAR